MRHLNDHELVILRLKLADMSFLEIGTPYVDPLEEANRLLAQIAETAANNLLAVEATRRHRPKQRNKTSRRRALRESNKEFKLKRP